MCGCSNQNDCRERYEAFNVVNARLKKFGVDIEIHVDRSLEMTKSDLCECHP